MTPEQYVQQKAAASGSSFYYAFLFLPKPRRAAITAFYAFCREVDDVVDEMTDPGVAAHQAGLVAVRGGAGLCRPAQPPGDAGADAAGRRLRHRTAPPAGRDRGLPDGPGADPLPRLSRPAALLPPGGRHRGRSRRAASSARPQAQTTAYAHKLGQAFQLTNIIRDVGEDALRGRIYLPMSELQQFDVKAHEILKRSYSDRFTRADEIPGRSAPTRCTTRPWPCCPKPTAAPRSPGLMMASIYRTLLSEIERDNFQVLHQRVSLTPLRKFWLAWKVQALGKLMRIAVIGAGWAGMAAAVRGGAGGAPRSRCLKPRARWAGGPGRCRAPCPTAHP